MLVEGTKLIRVPTTDANLACTKKQPHKIDRERFVEDRVHRPVDSVFRVNHGHPLEKPHQQRTALTAEKSEEQQVEKEFDDELMKTYCM